MRIFAQIPATVGNEVPATIAWWLGCLAIVLIIGLLVLKVAEKVRGQPLAGDVQAEAMHRYMPKNECADKHISLERRIEVVDVKVEELKDTLHEKINNVAREVSQLTEARTVQGALLMAMDGEADTAAGSGREGAS